MATLLEPDRAYSLWAESYPPLAHNELMRTEERAMTALWSGLRVERALDLGTGTGRNLKLLERQGIECFGLDRSLPMLRRAAGRLVCGDATTLPLLPESFDLVLSSLMAGDVLDLARVFREASRVLKRGGSLVYSDFHPLWEEKGWERTFESRDGRKWRLPYHPHAFSDHRASLRAASLDLVALEEPRLSGTPVLVAVRAVRV